MDWKPSMTTKRGYPFLSKFQNGELWSLWGYEKESKKDLAFSYIVLFIAIIIVIIIIIRTCYDHHHKYFGAIRSYPKLLRKEIENMGKLKHF